MKAAIIYSSKTGNTKKLAEVIQTYDESWDLINLKDKEAVSHLNLDEYALIFVGGWIDKATFNKECLDFITTIKKKKVVYFFTLGAYPTGKHAYECVKAITTLLEENENEIVNHFHCQGGVDPKLVQWMKQMSEERGSEVDSYRLKRWEHAANHPNEEDFDGLLSCVDTTIKSLINT